MIEKSVVLDKLNIKSKIYTIRGQQVMLDRDLAMLYRVKTHRLNEQVKRNIERFPKEFMFQLTGQEYAVLRSQFATSKGESQFATANNDETNERKNLISQFAISNKDTIVRGKEVLRSQFVASKWKSQIVIFNNANLGVC